MRVGLLRLPVHRLVLVVLIRPFFNSLHYLAHIVHSRWVGASLSFGAHEGVDARAQLMVSLQEARGILPRVEGVGLLRWAQGVVAHRLRHDVAVDVHLDDVLRFDACVKSLLRLF